MAANANSVEWAPMDSSEADPFERLVHSLRNAEYSTTRHDVLKVRVVSGNLGEWLVPSTRRAARSGGQRATSQALQGLSVGRRHLEPPLR